jgi:CRISPR-associated RAMP protein (TIGR02581 family)
VSLPNYRDFDSIKLLTRIQGTLINETPLRIGTGREAPLGSPVDVAVYRVNGVPCIPGSSLKGAFRSFIESIIKSQNINVHDPWEKDKIDAEKGNNDFCLICGIFGNTEIASHIRIYDALPKDAGKARAFIKYGIGIDREFGSVKPRLLFNEELIEPNIEWYFKVDIFNIKVLPEPDPDDKRASLIKNILDTLVKNGLSIGARKSVGCGVIKLREAKWLTYILENGILKPSGEGYLKGDLE